MNGRRSILFFALLLILVGHSFGQDLGSSNKLFGGARPSPSGHKKAAPKKAAAKRKPAVSKAKTSPPARRSPPAATAKAGPDKRTPAANKRTSKGTDAAAQVKLGGATPAKREEKVIIKTGPVPAGSAANAPGSDARPGKSPAAPVSAAAAELYEKLIEDGNFARDERNYAAAEAAYKRARPIRPRDFRAELGLGNLYGDQQRWDLAESAYREALKLEPNDPVIYIALSYVLSQPIAADDLGGRYEEAETLARRATQLDPRNPLAYDQLGVAMELRGLIGPETENAYRTAIKLDQDFAPPYAHLGRLLRRRGRVEESTQAYENAIRRAADVPTMVLVADVMQSEQRYADSEPLLRAAVSADPRNPTALLLLGQALTATGNFADAERFLRRSVDVSPNAFASLSVLGSLYTRQEKFEAAENALMQALGTASSNEKRRLAIQLEAVGDGYMRTGRTARAARVFKQAAALDSENEAIAAKLSRARSR